MALHLERRFDQEFGFTKSTWKNVNWHDSFTPECAGNALPACVCGRVRLAIWASLGEIKISRMIGGRMSTANREKWIFQAGMGGKTIIEFVPCVILADTQSVANDASELSRKITSWNKLVIDFAMNVSINGDKIYRLHCWKTQCSQRPSFKVTHRNAFDSRWF